MPWKLPDTLYSWAWRANALPSDTPAYSRSPGGLLLPMGMAEQEDALAHFNRLVDGQELAWLWLFLRPEEGLQLRLLADFEGPVSQEVVQLIESALPKPAPGQPDPCFLQPIPMDWLKTVVQPDQIQQIWIGFDFSQFVSKRGLTASTEVIPVEDFVAIAAR